MNSEKTIPGPRGAPILGVMPALRRDRLQFVLDMATKYGDVVKFNVLNIVLIQVNHPDAIQHVLQDNNKNYHKGFEAFPTLEMTLGHGLLTNEGESWLKQRRLMAPVFHQRNIERMGAMMTRRAIEMFETRWASASRRGETLNVAAEIMSLTLDIVTDALFSANVSAQAKAVGDAVSVLVEDVALRFDFPFYPRPNIPTPHNRAYTRSVKQLNNIIYGFIRERRASPNAGDYKSQQQGHETSLRTLGTTLTQKHGAHTGHHDLLQLLLDARDPETNEAMSDAMITSPQLRDELITLFIAGHETTANLLAWTFYLLSQHPEIELRLHDEVDSVLNGRTPTANDLPNLPYARRVLDETLRLYPPAWIINRTNLTDDELCGYKIPAHSFLAISPFVMHRHPAYWDNPEKFDPDRFLPDDASSRTTPNLRGSRDDTSSAKQYHRYIYFPFGGGPRLCIGKGFAQVEMQVKSTK